MTVIQPCIVFCTDENYAHPIPIIIESITRNCNEKCNFFIIYSSLNDNDKNNITEMIKLTENEVYFIPFDVKASMDKRGIEVEAFRNSYDAYTRVFLPEILKPYNVEKCLYLDTDLIINKSLTPLLKDLELIEYLGGCYDGTSKRNFDWLPQNTINSGVLLLNLTKLEKFSFTDKFLKFAKDNSSKYKELYDQDIINAIVTDNEKKIVDPRYNVIHSETDNVKNGIILHYTGPRKPWMSNCRWRYKKCMWVKYQILCKLRLKGWACGSFMEFIIHHFLVIFRVFFNTVFKIRKMFGNIKD